MTRKQKQDLLIAKLTNCSENEFVEIILEIRGAMGEPYQQALRNIYRNGIPRMRVVCAKKQMGIKNIEQRCTLSRLRQEMFCNWMDTKKWKATKNEIDLWDTTPIG